MNPLRLRHYTAAIQNIDRRAKRALHETHLELRARVLAALDELNGRFALWEAYRDEEGQEAARRAGYSNAKFGQSPHNFRPSLAVDVVLDPRRVLVGRHPADPEWPWLWDDKSPDALSAWADLEKAARRHHLHRVRVGSKLDRPHLELPAWRSYLTRDS